MGMVSVIRLRIARFSNRCRVIMTNKSLKGLKINKNRVLKALTSLISNDKGLLRESLGLIVSNNRFSRRVLLIAV